MRVFFMATFILATKDKMTRVFSEDGLAYAATVLKVAHNTVTQVKTIEKDGYQAVQIGYGERKEKNVNKAQRPKGLFANFREFRVVDAEASKVGSALIADTFSAGDTVSISGITKAKGFQGVVKRHGFSGGPRSHGQKHSEREPGSIGGGARAGGRVAKGMRMAGRAGGVRVTVKNLKVFAVDAERSELIVLGAVPGRRGTLLEVRGV